MGQEFAGRSVFVSGAGSGIGRVTAQAFAAEGAKLFVTDRDQAAVDETAAMITDAGGSAHAAMLDVTDAQAVANCLQEMLSTFGGIDVAFNNAGVTLENVGTPWGSHEAYARTMQVNVDGVVNCMRHQLDHMAQAGRGSIVNTASIAGMSGMGGAGYCGSKHAVVGLTRSAAIAFAAKGVRVNCVCPGAILTPMVTETRKNPQAAAMIDQMHPMGRSGTPEEVANAVLFLASDKASFITGHPLAVDGGVLAR